MNWIELLAAVGVGAIITKVMDVIWLQRVIQDQERIKWLRQEKLEAYSELSRLIMSFGKESGIIDDPFKGHAISSRATLLVSDETLIKDIRMFIDEVHHLYQQHKLNGSTEGHEALIESSQSLVERLREDLRN